MINLIILPKAIHKIGSSLLPKKEYCPEYNAMGAGVLIRTEWNKDYQYLDYILRFLNNEEAPFGVHELETA